MHHVKCNVQFTAYDDFWEFWFTTRYIGPKTPVVSHQKKTDL